MTMVRAMTITADSLLPRTKSGYDGAYDVAMKGQIVVVVILSSPLYHSPLVK